MAFDITPYIPSKQEVLDSDNLPAVFSRLRVQSLDFFPDVKTTPNSPFGNVMLNPLAHQIASYEISIERIRSDMILQNVADGTVFDCDFVTDYLANYGVAPDSAVPVVGVVRLTFQENKAYLIDRGIQILFEETGVFHLILPSRGDLQILPVGSNPQSGNSFVLHQIAENEFSINVSVVGSPGNVIIAGQAALTDIPDEELLGITAVNDFDTGRFPDNLPELAKLAQGIFYAANFADRGGAVSFIKRKLPNAVGASPVLGGDAEMQRDKNSILLITTGKMDVYVKGFANLVSDTALITVAENDSDIYRGLVTLPGGVPLYIDKITREDDEIADDWTIYGTSANSVKAKLASGAFSEQELLGIEVRTPNLQTTSSTFEIVKNSEPLDYPKLDGKSSGGIHRGSLFTAQDARDLVINANGIIAQGSEFKGVARVEDLLTGEVVDNVFIKKEGNRGVVDFENSPLEIKRMLSGIKLFFETSADSFDLVDTDSFLGETFEVTFKAKATRVKVHYRYDPAIQNIKDFVRSPEVQPVTDILVKGFNTAFVDNFTVTYRRQQGTTVNKDQIKAEIFEYINSLSYPNKYEEAVISDIMLFGGALGVQDISFSGAVHHSLAEYWSEDGEEDVTQFTRLESQNLLKFNDLYENTRLYNVVGVRNVGYILDLENIVLTEAATGEC